MTLQSFMNNNNKKPQNISRSMQFFSLSLSLSRIFRNSKQNEQKLHPYASGFTTHASHMWAAWSMFVRLSLSLPLFITLLRAFFSYTLTAQTHVCEYGFQCKCMLIFIVKNTFFFFFRFVRYLFVVCFSFLFYRILSIGNLRTVISPC